MNWRRLRELPENCEEEIWRHYIKNVIIPDMKARYNQFKFRKEVLPDIKHRSVQILSSMFINNVLKLFQNNRDKYRNIIFEQDTLDLVYEMLNRRPELLVSEKYYKDFIDWALLTKFSRMEP